MEFVALFTYVVNILKEGKWKGNQENNIMWVLHFIVFIMNFKVQGYSLCGRNYSGLRNSLRL